MKNFFKTGRKILFLFIMTSLFSENIHSSDIMLPTVSGNYDTARIFQAMQKARRGKNITIGVIGGSITKGYAASTESKNWANLMTDWWKSTFPRSSVTLINAGIGGTGSDIGAFRVQEDLLQFHPDFIVVEFSVNDAEGLYADKPEDYCMKMMEGLIRQLLLDSNHPGVMMLILKQENGNSARYAHERIGGYYKIPMINFAEKIDDQLAKDGIPLHNLYLDGTHPVDLGMQYIAQSIIDELNKIYKALPSSDRVYNFDNRVPNPLQSDVYALTTKCSNSILLPSLNSGWLVEKNGWKADTAWGEIAFKLKASSIAIEYTKHNAPDRGQVEVWVDDQKPVILDSYWKQTWGPTLVFYLVAENLDENEHILHLKVIPQKSNNEKGNSFYLVNVFKAGKF